MDDLGVPLFFLETPISMEGLRRVRSFKKNQNDRCLQDMELAYHWAAWKVGGRAADVQSLLL